MNIVSIFKEAKRIDADPFRWATIQAVAQLFPNSCWARLVPWAMFSEFHDMSEIVDIVRDGNNECAKERDGCYCGKFAGQLNKEEENDK